MNISYFKTQNIKTTPNKVTRELAKYIINTSLNQNYSIGKLKKLGTQSFTWQGKNGTQSGQVEYRFLLNHLHSRRSLDNKKFNFPHGTNYIDTGVEMSMPQPINASDGSVKIGLPLSELGKTFPISPVLNREGLASSNLVNTVCKNIVFLYKQLAVNSHDAVKINSQWFLNFRMLINELVSVVDMTLNKMYLLAEYGQVPNWKFDKSVLGERHGRRFDDKLKWVYQITGVHLPQFKNELDSLKIVKGLRNHLSHFDPPCLSISVEELVKYANYTRDIGLVMWNLRRISNFKLSEPLIEMILLQNYDFNSPYARPIDSNPDCYDTSKWP
ncbi:hypothetical protein M902_2346 [Bacteriovorax sp. BAL6_X]|uniref:hypothetical protein n=1 Tax=Bacteriovorax sp. BAL6_X TaxID=1201290 RepID=UPI000386EB3C|nr:hypothetical protein [Bacteriovorax sp. BAL6_X]EPZ52082.1 hypothetical protein M902_2346 [Bacteriovorax sp. BAL6_X]